MKNTQAFPQIPLSENEISMIKALVAIEQMFIILLTECFNQTSSNRGGSALGLYNETSIAIRNLSPFWATLGVDPNGPGWLKLLIGVAPNFLVRGVNWGVTHYVNNNFAKHKPHILKHIAYLQTHIYILSYKETEELSNPIMEEILKLVSSKLSELSNKTSALPDAEYANVERIGEGLNKISILLCNTLPETEKRPFTQPFFFKTPDMKEAEGIQLNRMSSRKSFSIDTMEHGYNKNCHNLYKRGRSCSGSSNKIIYRQRSNTASTNHSLDVKGLHAISENSRFSYISNISENNRKQITKKEKEETLSTIRKSIYSMCEPAIYNL